MDTNQRKVGRPKATPRTGPLVLGDERARTKVTLEISERANAELAEYTRWVEQYSGMQASEARFKTVDFALLETFRRDQVWQAKRRASPQPRPIPPATAPAAPAPALSPVSPPASTPRAPSPSPPPSRDPRTTT
jgi:hypothetical protein